MRTLDDSHKSVIENLETITRMKECSEEVERYLVERATAVFERCSREHPSVFGKVIERNEYGNRYINMPLTVMEKDAPFVLGVEQVWTAGILGLPSAEPLTYYVYSLVSPTAARNLQAAAPAPRGFVPQGNRDSYIHAMALSPMSKDDFLDPAKVERHFADPLQTLCEWCNTYQLQLLGA